MTADWEIRGSHVVAPVRSVHARVSPCSHTDCQCPHDGACPLRHPDRKKAVCGFSQRLQRPAFVRLTKHSNVGHEDIGYSYVVVRRGPRPETGDTEVGRMGGVGKRAIDKEASPQLPPPELTVLGDETELLEKAPSPTTPPSESNGPVPPINEPESHAELQQALRREAFGWPRIVFPPLKRSGHIILDCCSAEGEASPCIPRVRF
jgi:hypothetical protein